MSIYELYFKSDCFRQIVDRYVIKHRTSYLGAFNTIEIQEAYGRNLRTENKPEKRRERVWSAYKCGNIGEW